MKKHSKKKKDKKIKDERWQLSAENCMTNKEVEELFRGADIRKAKGTKAAIKDWFLIHLGLKTGLRASEMANLNCEHLELSNKEYPTVFVIKGKTLGSRRRVPINTELMKVIRKYRKYKESWGEPWDTNEPLMRSSHGGNYRRENLYVMFKRVLAVSKIKNPERLYTHSMRHTFAMAVRYQPKGDIEVVRDFLGHSCLETTRGYFTTFDLIKKQIIEGIYRKC